MKPGFGRRAEFPDLLSDILYVVWQYVNDTLLNVKTSILFYKYITTETLVYSLYSEAYY